MYIYTHHDNVMYILISSLYDFPFLGHPEPALLKSSWAKRHLERSDSATRWTSKPWNGEKRRETPVETPRFLRKKLEVLVFGEGKRDIEWGQGTMFGWLDCLFIGNLIITNMTIIWPSYDHICEHHGPWIMGVSDVFWPDTGSSPDSKKPPWANHNEVPKASSVRLWVVEPLEKRCGAGSGWGPVLVAQKPPNLMVDDIWW